MKYMGLIEQNQLPTEVEQLSETDRFNEYILTRLRTVWGIDLNQIKTQFGGDFQNILKMNIAPYLASNMVLESNNLYTLSEEGKYLADKISSDLFVID
jgi:oxygen-independent coproporphyrinogen-3 oxidase